MVCKTDNMWM